MKILIDIIHFIYITYQIVNLINFERKVEILLSNQYLDNNISGRHQTFAGHFLVIIYKRITEI